MFYKGNGQQIQRLMRMGAGCARENPLEQIFSTEAGEEKRVFSRTLKVRGGIISQANRYLGGFCSSQRIFPPQIIQVLLYAVTVICAMMDPLGSLAEGGPHGDCHTSDQSSSPLAFGAGSGRQVQ